MCSGAGLVRLELGTTDLAIEDLEERGADQLGHELRGLRHVINRLEAEFVRRLARFDELEGAKNFGCPSTQSFVRYHCAMEPGAAADRVLLARSRGELRSLTAAAGTGQISYDQSAIIARGASEVTREDAPEVEQRALELAMAGTEPGRLRHMTKAIVAEVDGKALERDEHRAHTRRYLRIGNDRDGSVHIEGLLESETAAYLRKVTDALMGPKNESDDRTGPQRRHDALHEALKGMITGGVKLPKVGGQRPHIVVVAPLSAMLGEGGPPALLQGLVPISREHLMRLAAEGTLSATLVDGTGREVYSGKARNFSAAKRRSMFARVGTCEWPGCDRPAEWCDGHHITPYAEGGLTAAAEGRLECRFHHRLREQGWDVVVDDEGKPRAVPPGDPDNPSTPGLLAAEASAEARRQRHEDWLAAEGWLDTG